MILQEKRRESPNFFLDGFYAVTGGQISPFETGKHFLIIIATIHRQGLLCDCKQERNKLKLPVFAAISRLTTLLTVHGDHRQHTILGFEGTSSMEYNE